MVVRADITGDNGRFENSVSCDAHLKSDEIDHAFGFFPRPLSGGAHSQQKRRMAITHRARSRRWYA
ncbi:hypothetical protein CRM94_25185 [Burkholderia gladioli]|uniref:Uncharacterized protein n=1 Tax=Burkholderia gladioli TaxID=28095 RepID=A0A2A7S2R7_BURGA|nr:hypothetical protein A8H28_27125 [Burkholderia gladioli pv. gladioli]PEH37782.1 hypothetical protein CRM94_25185 [Burkholderia gladioli]